MTDQHDILFSALADPTRRTILELLLARETMTAGQLAEQFPSISRPAVSRHVGVLRKAELLKETKEGREIYYRLNKAPLHDMDQWLQQFWMRTLESLKSFVELELDNDQEARNGE